MAPHAISPSRYSEDNASSTDGLSLNTPDTAYSDPAPTQQMAPPSLESIPADELHDLLVVGFGPAALAIAISIQDALESSRHSELSQLQSRPPRVSFLEKQDQFAWHAGMQIPGAKMQISWIKDLATMRNPRSRFTFLNYLHENDRLVPFSNLSTFLPLRAEYEDYMRWCAKQFSCVQYGQEAVSVTPTRLSSKSPQTDAFVVKSRNMGTGQIESRTTRHVVVATGGKPIIPAPLPNNNPRVIHSAEYMFKVPQLLPQQDAPYRIVVIGGGQSSAETFNDLNGRFPNAHTRLIIRGGALKPSDDSPFVNEIFDPDRVDTTFNAPPEVRASELTENKATNYGVVRLPLLESIYESLYEQRLHYKDESEWPHRVLAYHDVNEVEAVPESAGRPLRVHMTDRTPVHRGFGTATEEVFEADLVVVAVGYRRNVHEDLLDNAGAAALRPENEAGGRSWSVGRDYDVQFKEGAVSCDAGVWLQGCNETTHGLSDTLLSVLATRSWEVVSAIFGRQKEKKDGDMPASMQRLDLNGSSGVHATS